MMNIDYEKYRHHLNAHNFSRDQENQVIALMWKTMGAAAEEAWGYSSIQNIEQEVNEFSLREPHATIDSKNKSIKDIFAEKNYLTNSERLH